MAVIAFTSAMAPGDQIPRTTELNALTGEGGYEGLTLIISASHDGDSEAQLGGHHPDRRVAACARAARAARAAHRVTPSRRLGCLRHGGDDQANPLLMATLAGLVDARETMLGSGRRRRTAPALAAWIAPSHWRTRPAEKGDVMRTLRPFLVGAVTLALLAGLGGSVVAQSSEPEVGTGPVHEWVTPVSRTCEDLLQSSIEGANRTGAGEGFGWWRNYVYRCQEVLSDPRVSGDLTGDYNDDCWGAWPNELCVYWGTEELVGPDGTWTGAYHGTMKGTAQTSYKVMTGSGDYEGLTFIWHGTGELGSVDGHGFIYEGAPPPMPAE